MPKHETITVCMRELDGLKTIQAVINRDLKPGVAARRLNLTDRQLRRLVTAYRESSASGLISKKRGRPSTGSAEEPPKMTNPTNNRRRREYFVYIFGPVFLRELNGGVA